VLRALRLLFTAFDALVLFDVLLLLLLFDADNACVGVTLMCDDFVLVVELLVVFVVLLAPDDEDVEVELLELRFDELDEVFELLRFVDDDDDDV
jgi:hypothetical protein